MKKSVKLIILFAVLALAVGAYFVVSRLYADKDGDAVTYPAVDISESEVSGLEWSRPDDGAKVLALSGDEWVYEGDGALPVDPDKVDDMITALVSASSSTAVLETAEGADLSGFGLDEPFFSVTAKTADGTEVSVKLGEYNDYSGMRYMTSSQLPGVYLSDAAFADEFPSDECDLVLQEKVPSMSALVSYTVANGEKVSTVKHYSSGSPEYYTDTYKYFLVGEDAETPLDPSVADGIYTALFDLAWQGVAAYNVPEEELALYGLDAPVSEVTAVYTVTETLSKETDDGGYTAETRTHDETFTVSFGETEDGTFARVGGGDIVYYVDGATADEFRFDLRGDLEPAELLYLAQSEITGIELSSGTEKHVLSSTVTTTTDDDGDEVRNVAWSLDGSDDDATDVFNDTFDALNSLTVVRGVNAPALPDRAPDLTLHIALDTASSDITVLFYTDGNGDYICASPDGKIKTAEGEAVETVMNTLRASEE